MSESDQKTDGNVPAGTDAQPAAATHAPTSTPPATDVNAIPEGFELIRTEDKKNLISARDRANNATDQQAVAVNTLMKERGITKFLDSNKQKYPDLKFEDLSHVDDPDDLEAEADRIQARIQDAVQAKLLDVQKTEAPLLSPEQRTEQENKLKKNPDKFSFSKMLDLRSRPISKS